MRVLAIDTALRTCAACVIEGDAETGESREIAREAEAMERGHAEALLPLLERVVSRVEGGFEALDRVAVTVGPGSYTGLRVGLSAARAVGLAVGIPVVGVTTLSALLAPALAEMPQDAGGSGAVAAAIDARHGGVYLQAIGPDGILVPPLHVRLEEAAPLLAPGPVALVGSGAPAVLAALRASGIEAHLLDAPHAPEIGWIAALGAVADPAQALPRPLYLRGPDAAPQDHARLARR